MRSIIHAGLAAAIVVATAAPAFAECAGGHVKQQSVQAPTTTTTTTTATSQSTPTKPNG